MGERLRALRKSHNLTQEQLAEEIYITTKVYTTAKSISDYENDKVLPNPRTLQAIADYFHVTVDYLLKGNQESDDTEQTNQANYPYLAL